MKLKTLAYNHYGRDYVMWEAAYRLRCKMITEARAGLTGAYWWLPRPSGKKIEWEVTPFYDEDFDSPAMHYHHWRQFVIILANAWRKEPDRLYARVRNNYTGLPRGRVSRLHGGVATYGLLHGDDSPGNLSQVMQKFRLGPYKTAGKLKVAWDEHERVMADDARAVQAALGVDLGIVGISPDEAFDDEYDVGYA